MDSAMIEELVEESLVKFKRRVWKEAAPGCETDEEKMIYVSAKGVEFTQKLNEVTDDVLRRVFGGPIKKEYKPDVLKALEDHEQKHKDWDAWAAFCLRYRIGGTVAKRKKLKRLKVRKK